ncbi:MAG TPA: ATP-binding protein [Desulfomicrobiaceae bacterium]|nr:ATP-binding protein [Desulfomicrobiaceae bacterium]
MKKLPIGIQTFENLIEEGYVYVDKTRFVKKLADQGKYYFLSRPRRFGKSLFLSTIKAAYQGKRELFSGFFLHDNWEWSRTNPVIHISLGAGVVRSIQELQSSFAFILDNHDRLYDLTPGYTDLKNRFAELIQKLHDRCGRKVVLLIDEYDKPILDSIDKTDLAVAIRDELKNYYSVIKDADQHLELVFITGVSKFSKVSLFSGLNNLEDITLFPEYSAICGYTRQELESVFADKLQGFDLEQILSWYNGYSWLGERVSNPFDILLFLRTGTFSNYWFETATPTFLIKLLQNRNYPIPDLNNLQVGEKLIGSFDVDRFEVETLLFQTGYLTIKSAKTMGGMRRFTLGYPNQEVRQSLADYILSFLTDTTIEQEKNKFGLYEALEDNDFERIKNLFHAFFASIPSEWYKKNQTAKYEAYYASIVYCYFAATGMEVRPEIHSNKGRIDLTVWFENRIYVIEFKVKEQCGAGKALEQIRQKGYAEQFAGSGREVYLVGVEFSSTARNLTDFEWEQAY